MNEKSTEIGRRIAPVDGLRSVAVLGVLWAHVWAFSGTPKLAIFRYGSFTLDGQRLLSVVGTGVDLFFVISGFCMYLMYIRKQQEWGWKPYVAYMERRWLRLAPAFYIASLVSFAGLTFVAHVFRWQALFKHLVFLHTLPPKPGGLCAPFWSLGTEWQFYLILPLLLWACLRWGFGRVMAVSMLACLAFRTWLYQQPAQVIGQWQAQMPPRFIEFAWGMIIAHWSEKQRPLPRGLRGAGGFVVALAVVYAGRMLMTREVARLAGSHAALALTFFEPTLSLGYALVLWNVVASDSLFGRALSHALPQAIGRWSYSLYLWHWWPCYFIPVWLSKRWGPTLIAQYSALAAALALVIPLAYVSFRLFEAPYFTRRRKQAAP